MLSPPEKTRHRRAPRRKSCTECIKAKRRCDQESPCCARCAKQKLACLYIPYPERRSLRWPGNAVPITTDDDSNGPLDYTLLSPNCQSDDLGLLNLASSADVADIGDETLDVHPPVNLMLNSGFDTRLDQATSPTLWTPSDPVPEIPFAELSSLTVSRLNYGMKELKLAPTNMVLGNQTPWSHPLLYEEYMPRSMQDAYAACALYHSKTETNTRFIFRFIESRIQDLLAGPTPTTLVELLSRAQALLLYQTIQVFDGDIHARARADALVATLESLAHSLNTLLASEPTRDPPASLSIYPSGAAESAWKNWIFRESAHRSVLSIFFFLSLYYLLKGPSSYCNHHPPLSSVWTASAHLWNAASTFDFAIAWRERKRFLVRNLDVTELMAEASPDDIDSFGRIILVSLMGIDDIRGWFYTRGSRL